MTFAEFMKRLRKDVDAFEASKISDELPEDMSMGDWWEQFQFFSEGLD